ncbi:MAG: type VI secretion system protein TssA [Cellvibrionaceae bacterium]|nr:type VI secretion system protein TssA [Cellvibrionaceae bacterium]
MNQCITEADVSKLLQPITGDQSAVGDLRENISPTSSYQILRSARTTARNDERAAQNEGNSTPINSSDWSIILHKVPEVLANESKDIEIVAWYIEALTREFGFQGLAKGFSLARQLIEMYGDQLYPRPDEEGVISQLSSLAGLNGFGSEGALIYPIKAILITQGDAPGPLAIWQCEQVLEASRISDVEKREARFKQNGITREQLDEVLSDTETVFFQKLQKDILLAIDEYQKYQDVLDAYASEDPLPTAQIRDVLENSLKVLSYIAGDRLIDKVTEANDDKKTPECDDKLPDNISGPIADRDNALKHLREVADFFRRTEPHSPISYSIEQAIRWSGLPLTELIRELIPDDAARTKYQNLSGIGNLKNNKN